MAYSEFFPNVEIGVAVSDGLYSLVKYGRRWNTYARNALGDELLKHKQQRIPKHFVLGAAGVYGYAPRKESTRKKKFFYWRVPRDLDLVRSGRTSRYVLSNYYITFRGSYGGESNPGTLTGTLHMRMPYPMKMGHTSGITPGEIEREITTTTNSENRDIGEGIQNRIAQQINAYHGPMRYLRGSGRASTFPRTVL